MNRLPQDFRNLSEQLANFIQDNSPASVFHRFNISNVLALKDATSTNSSELSQYNSTVDHILELFELHLRHQHQVSYSKNRIQKFVEAITIQKHWLRTSAFVKGLILQGFRNLLS